MIRKLMSLVVILITAFTIIILGYIFILWWGNGFNRYFLQADGCVDNGGIWDQNQVNCILESENLQKQSDDIFKTKTVRRDTNSSSDKKSLDNHRRYFRIYRNFDTYSYLLGSDGLYYKSTESEKFNDFNGDYVEISAKSYSELSKPEVYYYGIKDYNLTISMMINEIQEMNEIAYEKYKLELVK